MKVGVKLHAWERNEIADVSVLSNKLSRDIYCLFEYADYRPQHIQWREL